MGVILYISSVNDEVSHRKKSANGEREGFKYRYGWAFFFNGVSFICSMIAAVNNITLYLMKPNQSKQPNFVIDQCRNLETSKNVMSPSEGTHRELVRTSFSELDSLESKETERMDKPYFNTITPV